MNGKRSRDKGAQGEREFLNMLSERLGIPLKRNLGQYQEGGVDNQQIADMAIEIKRAKILSMGRAWRQACMNAAELNKRPVLAYRLDRSKWKIIVQMDVEQFCDYASDLMERNNLLGAIE